MSSGHYYLSDYLELHNLRISCPLVYNTLVKEKKSVNQSLYINHSCL